MMRLDIGLPLVAESKHKHDTRMLFRKGKESTNKKPRALITDDLPSYHKAYLKEFGIKKSKTSQYY